MANLLFSDLENEVYAHIGLDSTNTANQTNVDRWLNYTQQDICSRWPWPFMLGQETMVTIPDYSTGTVSVNAGGTTVTGVGTAFTTLQADGTYYIQFNTANDWYPVSARASGTSITIGTAYQQTTNLSASAFTLRKFYYSLSSSADEIIDVVNWNTPVKLIQVDVRFIDGLNPNPQSTNSAYAYFPWGYDASGNLRITPYPFPSDARLFEIKTFKRPVDMTGTALPTLPNKWAHIIAFGANAVAFAYLRKPEMMSAWEKMFEAKILDMMSQERTSEDSSPILQSIDSGAGSTENWLQMPDNYPSVPGRP